MLDIMGSLAGIPISKQHVMGYHVAFKLVTI